MKWERYREPNANRTGQSAVAAAAVLESEMKVWMSAVDRHRLGCCMVRLSVARLWNGRTNGNDTMHRPKVPSRELEVDIDE